MVKNKTSKVNSNDIWSSPKSQEILQDDLNLSDFLTEDLCSNSKTKHITKRDSKSLKKPIKKIKTTTKTNSSENPGKNPRKKSSNDPATLIDLDISISIDEDNEGPPSSRTRRSMQLLHLSSETEVENVPLVTSKRQGTRAGGRGKGQSSRGRGRRSHNKNTNTTADISNEEVIDAELDLEVFPETTNQSCQGRLRVMRGRRRYLAEKAARCVQVDHIDLITSPMVPVTGFVDLCDDNENNQESQIDDLEMNASKNDQELSPNDLLSDENCEMNIRINWLNKIEFFKLRKYQKFKHIFDLLAEREQTNCDRILLNINDRIVNPNDTPDSLAYKFFHCIR